MRAVAIVDGEHYAAVVRHALVELPYDFAAAVLIGGQEKLRGGEEYGVPLAMKTKMNKAVKNKMMTQKTMMIMKKKTTSHYYLC